MSASLPVRTLSALAEVRKLVDLDALAHAAQIGDAGMADAAVPWSRLVGRLLVLFEAAEAQKIADATRAGWRVLFDGLFGPRNRQVILGRVSPAAVAALLGINSGQARAFVRLALARAKGV